VRDGNTGSAAPASPSKAPDSLLLTRRPLRPESEQLFIGFAEAEPSLADASLDPPRIVQLAARADAGPPRPPAVPHALAVFARVALVVEIFGRSSHLGVDVAHTAILPHLPCQR